MIKYILFIIYIIWIIISHEIIHYLVAVYYGYNPRFALLPNKKYGRKLERVLNFGLPFPSVRVKNVNSYRHAYVLLITPFPFGLVTIFLGIVFMTANIKAVENLYIWLYICFGFSLFATWIMSFGDIRTIKVLQKEEKNIVGWFKRLDDIK